MQAVTEPFRTVNSRLYRTPIYKVKFASYPDAYATHPVSIIRQQAGLAGSVDEFFGIDEFKGYDEFLPYPFPDQSHIGDMFSFTTFTATSAKPFASRFEGLQTQVYPEQGHSSVGTVTFTLTDKRDAVNRTGGDPTALVMAGLLGERTELYAGFEDIDEDDYLLFFTGVVGAIRTAGTLAAYEITVYSPQSLVNRDIFNVMVTALTFDLPAEETSALRVDGTSVGGSHYILIEDEIIRWEAYAVIPEGEEGGLVVAVLTRGALGTTAADHTAQTEVRELIYYRDHPMNILLGVLMNDNNTGCGLPADFVDEAGIAAAIPIIGAAYEMEFTITEPDNAMQWIEREIMQPLGCYPVMRGDGKYSIVVFHPPAASDAVGAIDHQTIAHDGDEPMMEWSLGRDGSLGEVFNDVTFRYDYNVGADAFLSTAQFERPDSVARFGRKPVLFESKGLHTAIPNTLTLITHRALEILNRYENGVPLVRLTTFLQQLRIEPGDIVELSSPLLPSRLTKERGITGELMECVNRTIRFDAGQVDFDLLWTGFALQSRDVFNREDVDWMEANDLNSEGEWATLAYTPGDIQIVDAKLVLGYNGAMVRTAISGSNQISQLTFREVLGAGGRSGPAVRLTYTSAAGVLATVSGYAALYYSTDHTISLRYYALGSDLIAITGLNLGSYPATVVFDDRLRLEANGPNFRVYLNGTLVISAYHESDVTGQPGALANSSIASPAGLMWDDWHGGDSGWA